MGLQQQPPPPQQQQIRMYGSPQVAQMPRLPQHQMHPRMSDFSPRTSFDESVKFETSSYVENVQQTSYAVNPDDHSMVQCSPRPLSGTSSYSLPGENSSIHLSAAPDLSSVDSQDLLDANTNVELLADLESHYKIKSENENESIDKKPIVGEAKTSLTFNIDEQGSGQDNDAVNDAIMTANDSNKESENQQQLPNDVKIKQEVIESTSTCSQQNNWLNQTKQIEIKDELSQVLNFFTFDFFFIFVNHDS